MKYDDMMMMVTNLYSSMITASCSSTVSRLCGSKPTLSIGVLFLTNFLKKKIYLILANNFLGRFLNIKSKSWPVLGKHL